MPAVAPVTVTWGTISASWVGQDGLDLTGRGDVHLALSGLPRGRTVVAAYVSDPARTTFESWATMARADQPEVVCAAGGATTIWVNFPQQKAVTLPDWMRKLVSD